MTTRATSIARNCHLAIELRCLLAEERPPEPVPLTIPVPFTRPVPFTSPVPFTAPRPFVSPCPETGCSDGRTVTTSTVGDTSCALAGGSGSGTSGSGGNSSSSFASATTTPHFGHFAAPGANADPQSGHSIRLSSPANGMPQREHFVSPPFRSMPQLGHETFTSRMGASGSGGGASAASFGEVFSFRMMRRSMTLSSSLFRLTLSMGVEQEGHLSDPAGTFLPQKGQYVACSSGKLQTPL